MPRRVVVLGGTGFIGRAFAWRCAAHGASIHLTIPTRMLGHGADLRPLPGLDLIRADVQTRRRWHACWPVQMRW